MTPFLGYPGQIWQAAYQAVNWYMGATASGTAAAYAQVSPALTVFTTLRNAVTAIDAWQTTQALNTEINYMTLVQALPLSLSSGTLTAFNARIGSITAAASGIGALPPAVSIANVASRMLAGTPIVPYVPFIEWCAAFTAEAPPSGTTAATLVTAASGMAVAWQAVAANIALLQGTVLTAAYDTAVRQQRVSTYTTGELASFTSSGFTATTAVTGLWNQCVALPTILLDAASLASAPYSLQAQECGVIRYALSQLAFQFAIFLLNLQQPQTGTIKLARLRNTDSMQDVAARSLGDFEQWRAIATLNGVLPPYPGPDNQTMGGQTVLLPGSTGAIASGLPTPSYTANVLGTDYDFGPVNGSMPTWQGDFNLITGLLNFARALGRRLQTPLGSLIYHASYGSRIPYEVGAIQGPDEASKLTAYGNSAIRSDPRTAQILSSSTALQPGFLAAYQASVTPIGSPSTPQTIGEIIGTQ
jgi:hypothetical protein